ncbi:hypothetical protein WG907_10195 [Sphingobium sp. AN558]|uniref:hypothetical protein n=1 Tax=Sphingobium sp. AN558 TaxID=3133442 RepID=UPI0030BDDD55
MSHRLTTACALMLALVTSPAIAQGNYSNRELRRAADAAILSDLARERQAEREDRRQPYASPGYGSIRSATGARRACASEALAEAGRGAKIVGTPRASTMATGWEVEGGVDPGDGHGAIAFVCSVRNGSVSGIKLQP